METNKPATKKATKKKAAREKKDTLVDDPPIIVGGGGSTLVGETYISLPKDTPKVISLGNYDIYRVGFDIRTIVTKLKKNGTPKKNKPEGDGWETAFHRTDV